jgi:hypothetical protein
VDVRRLRLGEWVAAGGGAALLVSLFLDWYGARVEVDGTGIELRTGFTAWQSFDVLDIVLVVVALLAIALAVLQAMRDSQALPLAVGILTIASGALAVLLVAYRMINQPGPNEFIEVRAGAWLGLFATLAIVVGGWESIREERVRGLPAGPDPELRPPPPRS